MQVVSHGGPALANAGRQASPAHDRVVSGQAGQFEYLTLGNEIAAEWREPESRLWVFKEGCVTEVPRGPLDPTAGLSGPRTELAFSGDA